MIVFGDGVAFFLAMELQFPVIGDDADGDEGREVAISVDRSSFYVVRRWWRLLLGEVRYRVGTFAYISQK